MTTIHEGKKDPFAALRIKEFSLFTSARFFLTIAIQMQGVIIGWQIKTITNSVLHLGLIGLAEAIPFLATSLFAGLVADKVVRKKITLFATFFYIACLGLFFAVAKNTGFIVAAYGVFPIYAIIFVTGIVRGFLAAAMPAYMAQLVPRHLYANASTWNSTAWHVAFITGNGIGGFMCAVGIPFAYAMSGAFSVIAFALFLTVGAKPLPANAKQENLLNSLTAGLKFVFNKQVMLAALSLDLFAVLFGGAVALLPVFATDILKVDAIGFGWLRAAPAIGAVIMAFILAYHPPRQHAGKWMLWSVGLFGLCTILFALSKNYYLSLLLLGLTGVFDNVSVVVRHTILQLMTPDEMRGRVSAVNSIFIGSSNEIGAFESGLAASLIGLIPSVVFGGSMTLLVVIVVAILAPKLKTLDLEIVAKE